MKTLCQLKKNSANKNSRIRRTKQNTLMLVSNFTICSKKLQFIKNQEASGLLSKLGIRIPLNIIPVIGDILFYG